ncbi:MAG: hypothetical protein QOJ07_455 [Thermoleophilaceae bacterium]|jgi:DNA-binding transcriptional MerR regulator|nr:hypothetical protein [Thermoleophilaceae bacterium]
MGERALQAIDGGGGDEPQLTIEQLAAETGMSVRNIRNHQSRGLLPAPEVRLRVGYYGPAHVERLRVIQELQADGFNLKAIERLVTGEHGAAERILGAKRVVTKPFETEQPQIFSAEELAERFGETSERDLLKAQKLGLLRPVGGDRFEAASPSLLDAAEEVMKQGVSLHEALSIVEGIRRHCQSVARSFVKLYEDNVWRPFEDAGQPEAEWPEIVESIERLRPLASQALLGVFEITMTQEATEAFGKALQRQAERLKKR